MNFRRQQKMLFAPNYTKEWNPIKYFLQYWGFLGKMLFYMLQQMTVKLRKSGNLSKNSIQRYKRIKSTKSKIKKKKRTQSKQIQKFYNKLNDLDLFFCKSNNHLNENYNFTKYNLPLQEFISFRGYCLQDCFPLTINL